ncbi:MAG: hypothetical protein E7324_04245 [Clostridiales bacterium]|nr:hypothetical protein [Clostridiales bacterium]
MRKSIKYGVFALGGSGYAALAILLSQWLIRNLSGILGSIGGLFGMNEDTLSYIVQVLDQLKGADIASPWLGGLLIGAAIGLLLALLIFHKKPKHIIISILPWVLLLIPLGLIALWFTDINDIRFGTFLSVMLPMLSHL